MTRDPDGIGQNVTCGDCIAYAFFEEARAPDSERKSALFLRVLFRETSSRKMQGMQPGVPGHLSDSTSTSPTPMAIQ